MLASHRACNGCYVMPCSNNSREFDKVLELGNSTPTKKQTSHAINTDADGRIFPVLGLLTCGII